MALEKIVKKIIVPLVALGISLGSVAGCKSISGSDENSEPNISSRQEQLIEQGSKQRIEYGFVPEIGSFSYISGKVYNADPGKFMVSAWIQVNGTWWMKPYWASPLTPIKDDGSFEFDYTTGGIDSQAERINAYVVSNDFVPEYHTLPDLSDPKVFSGVTVYRK